MVFPVCASAGVAGDARGEKSSAGSIDTLVGHAAVVCALTALAGAMLMPLPWRAGEEHSKWGGLVLAEGALDGELVRSKLRC